MTSFSVPPRAPAYDRARLAYQRRHETDYEFDSIARNIVLIIFTCGIYGYFVDYRLMKRDRDHQRRALDLLEAANEVAWEQAITRGAADELRPNFERVAGHLGRMRHQTSEFRDPKVWLGIIIAVSIAGAVFGLGLELALQFAFSPFGWGAGLVVFVMYILIDSDYVKHDVDEGAIQAELSAIFGRLGENVPPPDRHRLKGKHNYGGRIAATIFTLSIYQFWWTADLMREGNWHMYHCWVWEDGLAGAMSRLSTTPPPALTPGAER